MAIDDDQTNLDLLAQVFARAGFSRFTGFSEPRAAVDAINDGDVDLILLDLDMPDLSGLEVLSAIQDRRDRAGYLPVIILTAEHSSEMRREALSGGATDYLTKPFAIDEVILRSRNLLETRRLHKALAGRIDTLDRDLAERGEAMATAAREHAAVSASLVRLSTLEEPIEIGTAVCADLAAVANLPYVTLFIFDAPDRAIPFVIHGAPLTSESTPLITASRSQELWDRASAGPWVEDSIRHAGRSPAEATVDHRWRSSIHAPVRSGSGLVGILSTGTDASIAADDLARRLPSVVEYAGLAGALLGRALIARREVAEVRRNLGEIISERAFDTVFQPIVTIPDRVVVAYEALTRFHDGMRPDRRFAAAVDAGIGVELELATLESAIRGAEHLPRDAWLTVNVSPAAIAAGERLGRILRSCRHQLVLELTEHSAVDDYPMLRGALKELGVRFRVAIDDAGAGYASMQHVVELEPSLVKLDISLIRGIDRDPARQALVAGMRFFADRVGFRILAEGIETEEEFATLGSLGVPLGQGFLLGRPAALPHLRR
ncbi:MAG TPA: EAL domain-containing response regulator [Candidatus Acidoferrum sp.]|nr:EAL domain-containing response regulator [Candidatus Acidoferrum sp.]